MAAVGSSTGAGHGSSRGSGGTSTEGGGAGGTGAGGRSRTPRRPLSGFACRVPFLLGLLGLAVVCLVTAVNGSASGGGAPAAATAGTLLVHAG